MAEHLRDATKKMDFISTETVIKEIKAHICFPCPFKAYSCTPEKCGTNAALKAISEMHAADVVSRDCYDRILAENDIMREMLAQISKKPGDKMDDVRPVIYGEWEYVSFMTVRCSNCKETFHELEADYFCPNCGADMRKAKANG